ncbi:MAG: hypothetical protein K940chlam3_01206 [Chlamydiae bacterium]|nr:hypothetical protein [Chlamydiota bacterium]
MLYHELTNTIIGLSFEIMNELGVGFLESVYQKSLLIALEKKGFIIHSEVSFPVLFRGTNVGNFRADLIVERKIILEIKAVDKIIGVHKAQVINYLKAINLPIGLIINFGQPKIQTARLQHPNSFSISS